MDNLEGMRIVAAGMMGAAGVNGPAPFDGKGVSGVERTAQGQYTVTLSGGYGSGEYVVMATFPGANYVVGVNRGNGSFDLSIVDSSTLVPVDTEIMLMVVQFILGTEL